MIREGVPLGPRSSLGVGGTARWWVEPSSVEELAEQIAKLRHSETPVFILGGGTNTLFQSGEYPGAVISTRQLDSFEVDTELGELQCEAGLPLTRAIRLSIQSGLRGLERFTGIPGTVGGAIYGNAGGAGVAIGTRVRAIEVIQSDGSLNWIDGSQVPWAYRDSGLGSAIVARVRFFLDSSSRNEVRSRAREMMDKKRSSQPLSAKSAGCMFRNPEGDSAGRLIEAAGLKGYRCGDAMVSEQHANFIVNVGSATADQVESLIAQVRDRVREQFEVELMREVVSPALPDRIDSGSIASANPVAGQSSVPGLGGDNFEATVREDG